MAVVSARRRTVARGRRLLLAIVALSASATVMGACRRSDAREAPAEAAAATADARPPAEDSARRAAEDSVHGARPGYVVDSILPPAEALRRFAADLPHPGALAHGAPTREALVALWARAVAANDSITVIRSTVNRGEFAYLIYPELPLANPPTHQPPAIAWLQLSNASIQGFRRIMDRRGGEPMRVDELDCPQGAERHGALRLWRGCRVRITQGGTQEVGALFGPIVERGGTFKFLSLENDL